MASPDYISIECQVLPWETANKMAKNKHLTAQKLQMKHAYHPSIFFEIYFLRLQLVSDMGH